MNTGGSFYYGPSYPSKGCFAKNNNVYFGTGGSIDDMSTVDLPGVRTRLWCDAPVAEVTDSPSGSPITDSPTTGSPTNSPTTGSLTTDSPTTDALTSAAPSVGQEEDVTTDSPTMKSTEGPTDQVTFAEDDIPEGPVISDGFPTMPPDEDLVEPQADTEGGSPPTDNEDFQFLLDSSSSPTASPSSASTAAKTNAPTSKSPTVITQEDEEEEEEVVMSLTSEPTPSPSVGKEEKEVEPEEEEVPLLLLPTPSPTTMEPFSGTLPINDEMESQNESTVDDSDIMSVEISPFTLTLETESDTVDANELAYLVNAHLLEEMQSELSSVETTSVDVTVTPIADDEIPGLMFAGDNMREFEVTGTASFTGSAVPTSETLNEVIQESFEGSSGEEFVSDLQNAEDEGLQSTQTISTDITTSETISSEKEEEATSEDMGVEIVESNLNVVSDDPVASKELWMIVLVFAVGLLLVALYVVKTRRGRKMEENEVNAGEVSVCVLILLLLTIFYTVVSFCMSQTTQIDEDSYVPSQMPTYIEVERKQSRQKEAEQEQEGISTMLMRSLGFIQEDKGSKSGCDHTTTSAITQETSLRASSGSQKANSSQASAKDVGELSVFQPQLDSVSENANGSTVNGSTNRSTANGSTTVNESTANANSTSSSANGSTANGSTANGSTTVNESTVNANSTVNAASNGSYADINAISLFPGLCGAYGATESTAESNGESNTRGSRSGSGTKSTKDVPYTLCGAYGDETSSENKSTPADTSTWDYSTQYTGAEYDDFSSINEEKDNAGFLSLDETEQVNNTTKPKKKMLFM